MANNNIPSDRPVIGRKPSFRNQKPPQIRQTLTTQYRLFKNNPILLLEQLGIDRERNGISSQAIRETLISNKAQRLPEKKLNNGGLSQKRIVDKNAKPTAGVSGLSKQTNRFDKAVRSNSTISSASGVSFKHANVLSSTRLESQGNMQNTTTRNFARNNKVDIKTKNERKTSAPHVHSKAKANGVLKRRSISLEEIPRKTVVESPIREVITASNTNLEFKTPSSYSRRSFYHKTPGTSQRTSLFLSTPSSAELKKRLNDWLTKRGKSVHEFTHIKCFGYNKDHSTINKTLFKSALSTTVASAGIPSVAAEEENKENQEINILDVGSYEDLGIFNNEEEEKANTVTNYNYDKIGKDALVDLHNLIMEGYPRDQCEIWLKLMSQKCQHLEEQPEYWECRAALEQARGNIGSAVECYKTAIVQGAEVNSVDQSLDYLLKKFSLLNIDSNDATNTQDRARIVSDARNVFKSSIIQFAVQERANKKRNNQTVAPDKKFVATPVRRSTRQSRSAYTSTPGVQIYSSLQDIGSPVRSEMSFQRNNALLN